MLRDTETTDIFRRVARKAQGEHLSDAPNSRSFLSDLADKITQHGFTTGDELIDCMVAWYQGGLEKQTINRFHSLDEALKENAGEAVLLVTRERKWRMEPRQITSQYWMGKATGEGLLFNLPGGRCSIPTEGSTHIDARGEIAKSSDAILVFRANVIGFDDDWLFTPGAPNLAKDFTVDGRVEEEFDPDDYLSQEHAIESLKPPIEVVLGTERVEAYIAADARLAKLLQA